MSTRWKPPSRHLLTASRPFIAVCQRTFRRFINASRSLRLMMLSSTMSTLIGGTVPSRRLVAARKGPLLLTFFLDFRGFCDGRGEDTRGGGVRTDFGVCSGD